MNIMLDRNDAKKVMDLLISMGVCFEVSPKGEFIKISAILDDEEVEFIDSFLDTL